MTRQLIALIALVFSSLTAQAASQMYYIHTDHLGTPQVLTDSDQQVVWEGRQMPFGELHSQQGTITQPLRFPGQYADPETGFHYNYYRDYDPSKGRYIQSDPIGLWGGINTYGYVLQNPMTSYDPNGLQPAAAVPVAICLANPICREAARRTVQACANLAGAGLSYAWSVLNESSGGTRNLDELEPIHEPDHPQNDPDIEELSDEGLLDALTNPRDGDRVTVKGNRVYDGNTRVNEAKARGFDGSLEIPVIELPNQNIDYDNDPLGGY